MGNNKKIFKFLDFITIFTWISLTNGRVVKEDYSSFIPDGHLEGVNFNGWGELSLQQNPDTTLDLGVDIPNYEVPTNIRKALANATLSNDVAMNQYAPTEGVPRLTNSLAKLYKKLTNLTLDPKENIVITAGAVGAIFNSLLSNIIPGDEWIFIEPCFTIYKPITDLSKGIARFTSLKLRKRNGTITSSDWILDRRELASLFNNRTKGILINNPNNPIGKEYTYNELQFIAKLAKKWNVIVISDEAHEFVTRKPHMRIAALPGMFKRTITIGTSTKTFSVSGWRIGWAYGPANLIRAVKAVGSRTAYFAPTPMQEAIGFGVEEELRNFGEPESYFVIHRERGRQSTNLTVQIFKESGMIPIVPEGINCVLVNWTSLKGVPVKPGETGSANRFRDWLLQKTGILGFPLTMYCSEQNQRNCEDYIRYCYDKKEETIDELGRRLKKLKLECGVKSVENNL